MTNQSTVTIKQFNNEKNFDYIDSSHDSSDLSVDQNNINERWSIFYNYVMGNLHHISQDIAQSINDLGINSYLPNKEEMNKIKENIKIDLFFTKPLKVDEWFQCLSQGKFPHYKNVRSFDEIKQSSKPDFFHDFIGHIPMLTQKELTNSMLFFAKEWVGSTQYKKDKLIKLWFYIIEFGLVLENDGIKAFGGGLITSKLMMDKFIENDIETLNYDYCKVLNSTISLSGKPECLFVFDSIPHANKALLDGVNNVIKQ